MSNYNKELRLASYESFVNSQEDVNFIGNLDNGGKKYKIASWNVNSIRTGIFTNPDLKSDNVMAKYMKSLSQKNVREKYRIEVDNTSGILRLLDSCDIICLQETKFDAEVFKLCYIEHEEHTWRIFASQSNSPYTGRGKNSYSGTAILLKDTVPDPIDVITYHDDMLKQEGRFIHLVFENFNLINVYVPNSISNGAYRMNTWHNFLRKYTSGISDLIMAGDFNVARTVYDRSLSDKPEFKEHKPMQLDAFFGQGNVGPGFYNAERDWMENAIYVDGVLDVWRELNPGVRNAGYTFTDNMSHSKWRIDYFLIRMSRDSFKITNCVVLDYKKAWSDHSPLVMTIHLK